MRRTITRTLIIRFSSVGDIVLSSLLIRVLRRRFPDSQIDYLVKAEFAELVRGNPNLTRVLEFPSGGTFTDLRNLRRTIRTTGYDLILDIHNSLRSRFLCVGASRVGRFRKRAIARFLLIKRKWNVYESFGGSPSVAERYLEPVMDLGVTNDGQGLELFLDETDVRSAESLLHERGINSTSLVVGIAPSARHWNKMWPPDSYVEAAAGLLRQRPTTLLLLGAEADRDRCSRIEEGIRNTIPDSPIENLAGQLTLSQTAAVMDKCAAVISNDSGLMHIAAARKRPLVALFGPTVRELGFFPYGTRSVVLERNGLECRPCTHIGRPSCPEDHFRCMREIPAGDVVQSVERLLEQ